MTVFGWCPPWSDRDGIVTVRISGISLIGHVLLLNEVCQLCADGFQAFAFLLKGPQQHQGLDAAAVIVVDDVPLRR
jgi:hypothetical protein